MQTDTEKKPLIIIAGPTAVGKSALGIRLAQALGGEIISADSMQVYRRMDIGTAKVTEEEKQGIPHHLIDILEPTESYSVREFCLRAKPIIEEIYGRGHWPIVVGGTGFYIRALAYDASFPDEQETSMPWAQWDDDKLYERLKEVDPASATIIHPHNRKRMMRALAFYEEHQSPISLHNETQKEKESPYRLAFFVLNMDRQLLYERINERVLQMVDAGLTEEVKALLKEGVSADSLSMQGIGYKEMLRAVCGDISEEEAIEEIKTATRHFAKRQLTWFRREKEAHFVDAKDPEKAYQTCFDWISQNI